MPLILILEESYGGGEGKPINRHISRTYEDEKGNRYILDRNMSGCPPFFELLRIPSSDYEGILPQIKVGGDTYFCKGKPWAEAIKKMNMALGYPN